MKQENNVAEDYEENSATDNRIQFQGFARPESNYFRMPNNWTDITAEMNSLAELKVVEYILRHTWGFQEFGVKRRITVDEFINGRKRMDGTRIDKGTRLSEQSVRNGLKLAVDEGYILEEIDARDRARIKKYYCLRMQEQIDSDESDESIRPLKGRNPNNTPKTGVKTLDPSTQHLYNNTHDLDPRAQNLDPRSQNFIPRSEKNNQNNLNQKNQHKQVCGAAEQNLIDFGVLSRTAHELSNLASEEIINEWLDYATQNEAIRDKPAFVVKMLRAGETPNWSRPVGRAQKGGIDFSQYTRPGGKYYNLVRSTQNEEYEED